jgi:hypothetical protein
MINTRAPANAASLPNSRPAAGKAGPKSLRPKYLLKFKTSKEDPGTILTGLFEKVYADGTKSFGGKNRDTGAKYGLFFNEAKEDRPASVVVKVKADEEAKWELVSTVSLKDGKFGPFYVGDGSFNGVSGTFYVSEAKQ